MCQIFIALLLALSLIGTAHAQTYGTAGSPPGGKTVLTVQPPASGGTNQPVSGTGSATPPSASAAPNQPLVMDLHSGLFVQPSIAGTPVDGTHGLPSLLVAGSAIAGKVGIDQTTPGTTNGVGLEQIGSTTVLAGAGATGAGSQRQTVAQDTTTIAGSAPGIAGTPSANVVSVQGVSGGTGLPVSAAALPLPTGAATAANQAPPALTPVAATAAGVSNQILKGSGGTFYGATVNTTTTAVWVMLFNFTTLPSNGAVTPLNTWQVPANTTISISENPAYTMGTGIVLACSTTGSDTLTASATCKFSGGMVQ